MPIASHVDAYDHLLVDLDGTLWVEDEPVPGAARALQTAREAGKGVAFLTNDPAHHPEEYVRKLWRLGFQAALDEVVTVGAAVQYMLAGSGRGGTAFVIGGASMIRHVTEAGLRVVNGTPFASRAEVVVVSGHREFDYGHLRTAIQAVVRGARLIGTSRDPTFPMGDGPWPGSGAVLAAVEVGSGRQADAIAGKPEPAMYATALDRLGAGRALVIGDRLEIDVVGAHRAGLDSALVLTGGAPHTAVDAVDPTPTHVAESFATLLLG